jgi:hypothetical protein
MEDGEEFRVAKTSITKIKLGDDDGWVAYWLTKSLDERLGAIEFQRKMLYGYETCPRLQRSTGITRKPLR